MFVSFLFALISGLILTANLMAANPNLPTPSTPQLDKLLDRIDAIANNPAQAESVLVPHKSLDVAVSSINDLPALTQQAWIDELLKPEYFSYLPLSKAMARLFMMKWPARDPHYVSGRLTSLANSSVQPPVTTIELLEMQVVIMHGGQVLSPEQTNRFDEYILSNIEEATKPNSELMFADYLAIHLLSFFEHYEGTKAKRKQSERLYEHLTHLVGLLQARSLSLTPAIPCTPDHFAHVLLQLKQTHPPKSVGVAIPGSYSKEALDVIALIRAKGFGGLDTSHLMKALVDYADAVGVILGTDLIVELFDTYFNSGIPAEKENVLRMLKNYEEDPSIQAPMFAAILGKAKVLVTKEQVDEFFTDVRNLPWFWSKNYAVSVESIELANNLLDVPLIESASSTWEKAIVITLLENREAAVFLDQLVGNSASRLRSKEYVDSVLSSIRRSAVHIKTANSFVANKLRVYATQIMVEQTKNHGSLSVQKNAQLIEMAHFYLDIAIHIMQLPENSHSRFDKDTLRYFGSKLSPFYIEAAMLQDPHLRDKIFRLWLVVARIKQSQTDTRLEVQHWVQWLTDNPTQLSQTTWQIFDHLESAAHGHLTKAKSMADLRSALTMHTSNKVDFLAGQPTSVTLPTVSSKPQTEVPAAAVIDKPQAVVSAIEAPAPVLAESIMTPTTNGSFVDRLISSSTALEVLELISLFEIDPKVGQLNIQDITTLLEYLSSAIFKPTHDQLILGFDLLVLNWDKITHLSLPELMSSGVVAKVMSFKNFSYADPKHQNVRNELIGYFNNSRSGAPQMGSVETLQKLMCVLSFNKG
jgi:hypothetical protein